MEDIESQHDSSRMGKFKAFVHECARVLRITKKPTTDEFKTMVRVSGLGILIIGLMGFIVQMIKQLLIK